MQLKPALPTGSGSSERRSGERRRVRLLARARGGDRTYTLEIMDISQRGMLLRGAVPLDQGDKVEIELSDRAEDNIIATVAWAAGANLGCYLERALTPAELAHAALRARPSNLVNDPIGQEILQAFGARIRQLRRASDMTMLELGKIVGVSKPTVWKWESGKARPREGALDALAQALNTTAALLLYGVDEPAGFTPSPGAQAKEAPDIGESLPECIGRCRSRIARRAGVDPSKVVITIDWD